MTNEVLNTDASPAPRRGRKRADATNEVRVVSQLHSIEERQQQAAYIRRYCNVRPVHP